MKLTLTVFGLIFPQDLFALQVFMDEIVAMFPDCDRYICGDGIHRVAPLLAMGEALPVDTGEVCAACFLPGTIPVLGTMTSESAKRKLCRPLCLPTETEWVLFDTDQRAEPKWLVRLCDLRRITLSKRDRVCVVFNDFVFALKPCDGTTARELFDRIKADFPKSRDRPAQPGEVSVFSVWRSQADFLQPFPAIAVAAIEKPDREEDVGDLVAHLGDFSPRLPHRKSGPTPPEQST